MTGLSQVRAHLTTKRELWPVTFAFPVLLVGLVLAATWKLTLGDRIIARGDLLLYFYPLRDYAAQAIREGRLPLWNPYTFMGAPFLANAQVGFFYPFNVLMAWLPVERAVSWNIALHLAIAALGAYALARRGFVLGRPAAFCSAVAFGLGGYLGAQVEHLNQLQVLAWLPFGVLIVMGMASRASRVQGAGSVVGLALVIALQILAGHTQSLYISLVTLGLIALWLAAAGLWRSRPRGVRAMARAAMPLLVVGAGALLAAAMCAVQLLPTLELARESARAGGLPFNEAASFSWRPWVVARALMPTYGDPLFPEYIAYLGASGLALALLGGLEMRDWRTRDGSSSGTNLSSAISQLLPWILVLFGCVLALGAATPLFNALYRFMPGFSYFRAQARWLIVFALGAAILVGFGVQRLREGLPAHQARRWLLAWLMLVAVLTVGVLAGARLSPEPEYRALPARGVLVGWAAAALGITVLIVGGGRVKKNLQSLLSILFCLALTVELFAASQFQPYARAADRQAFTSLRPATAHLLAQAAQEGTMRLGRILALSSLFFDPGDKAEQELLFSHSLSADETYDRLIAAKHKEILSPNLPLYYRLPSVDGYDGGLLPIRRYVAFVRQFTTMPTGAVDGRLREFLTGPPAGPWLEQMAVRYLIADKTQDVFLDGVYYDLLFSTPISPVANIPLRPFSSTALGLVLSAAGAPAGAVIATADVRFADGETRRFEIRAGAPATPYFGARLQWAERRTPLTVSLRSAGHWGGILRGMTGIDETDGTFLSQTVIGDHDMRLVHSGDVKIYENLRRAPRVALQNGQSAPVDIAHVGGEIVEDRPEFIRIRLPEPTPKSLQRRGDKRLILRDACFPGWVARVDGVETPIACADVLFRAVVLPAGAREVTFSYEPKSVRLGMIITAAGAALWLALVAWSLLHARIQRVAQAIAQEGE